ncbi:MAG TPA: hypothetical protein V6C76_00910 [Drouetiella sp.]
MTIHKLLANTIVISMLCPTAALAADWGYDDVKKLEELKAAPAKSLMPKAAQPAGKSASAAASQAKADAPQSKAAPPKAGNLFSRTPSPQAATQESLPVEATATMAPPLGAPQKVPAKPVAKSAAVKSAVSTKGKTNTARPAARAGHASTAAEDWIEVFDIVSKEQLTADQKSRFRENMTHILASDRGADYSLITQFWPEVQERVKSSEDQKIAFSTMFRALLRFVSKSKKTSDEEGTVISEVLGPERIAVQGNPPLTEEGVDAYGDMACFLYEQSHPGKSVDAVDNRAVFASVVARKYDEAPTEKDKQAIAHFALKWSKFRVTYLAANESDKKIMGEEAAAGKPTSIKDPLVTTIFTSGPWR